MRRGGRDGRARQSREQRSQRLIVSVRSILAERTRKRLRFAILRPLDEQRSRAAIEELREGMDFVRFQNVVHRSLGGRCKFAGYATAGSKKLFTREGYPTGDTIRPGDVIDEIAVFDRACEAGVYKLEESDLGGAPN